MGFEHRCTSRVILERLGSRYWIDAGGQKRWPLKEAHETNGDLRGMDLEHVQNTMKFIVEHIPHMMGHYAIDALKNGWPAETVRNSLESEKAFFERVIWASPLWTTLKEGQRKKISTLHQIEHHKPKRARDFSNIPEPYEPYATKTVKAEAKVGISEAEKTYGFRGVTAASLDKAIERSKEFLGASIGAVIIDDAPNFPSISQLAAAIDEIRARNGVEEAKEAEKATNFALTAIRTDKIIDDIQVSVGEALTIAPTRGKVRVIIQDLD